MNEERKALVKECVWQGFFLRLEKREAYENTKKLCCVCVWDWEECQEGGRQKKEGGLSVRATPTLFFVCSFFCCFRVYVIDGKPRVAYGLLASSGALEYITSHHPS